MRAREAISARIDGEDPALPGGVLETHLAGCGSCRAWQQRAHAVTRRCRLGGAFLEQDLTPRVLAAIPPAPASAGRHRALAQRSGLVVAALAQLAITVPLLVFGHDHGAGVHAAHELGAFDLALAIAFAVGALRPALSAGLAWPCGIAAAGLVATAVADVLSGQASGAGEAQQLIAVAGAALLCWQAWTARAGSAGASPVRTAAHARAGTHSPAAAEPRAVVTVPGQPGSQFDGPPDPHSPGGGGARVGHGAVA